MFFRCLIMIVLAAVIGAVLLDLRQQRVDDMYDMAKRHRQMRVSREKLWDTQTRIADLLEPEKLEAAIERADLELEPITPTTARQLMQGNSTFETRYPMEQ